MASLAQSIDFKTVVSQLPTAKQQVNFSHICNRVLGIAHYADENPTAFFDVTAKALKGCDNNYHLYKPQLSQLFEINDSYQAKSGAGFCKKYRLKIPILLSNFEFKDTLTHSESVDFDHDPLTVEMAISVLKSLTIATGEQKTSRPLKTEWQANHFLKQYIQLTITPQYVSKRINLNTDLKTFTKKNKVLPIKGSIDSFLESKVCFTQTAAAFILNEIRQQNFFCSVTPTNGRLNTSFTSLASAMTKYLRLDGGKLKGIDICNSQFLIFAVLLKNCVSEGKMFKFLEKNGYLDSEILGKGEQFTQLRLIIEELKMIVLKVKKGDDFNTFITQCENGTIYEDFAQAANITRTQAKAAFFHILFGAGGQTEYSNLFAQIYPSVNAIIKRFKRLLGYQFFSVMLQKIESLYFIKTLLPTCYAQKIKILTKHDSVVCSEHDFKKLERIFMDVMTKFFNDKFTTKVEN
jgi:hypothetical protein